MRKIKRFIQIQKGGKQTVKFEPTIPKYQPTDMRMKIAIIQTGSWGDNINSTIMLKPLKERYPDAVIDVHTSTHYGSAFINNPYIDNIVQHESHDKNSSIHLTLTIPDCISNVGYNYMFAPHPMYNPGKWNSLRYPELGDNLIYSWVRALEEQDIPYQMPLESVLRLSDEEVDRVRRYIGQVPNFKHSRNILMEVHTESGQSFWNHAWTMEVGKHLLNGDTNLFISRKDDGFETKELLKVSPGRVYPVGSLSIRECAELFNHCDMFFSVSSGLSNACNTNWCKKTGRWIETVNSPAVTSAPIRSTGKTFWHDNNISNFVEMLKSQGI